MKKYGHILFFIVIVCVGIAASFTLFPDKKTEAASADTVYGYAWSDTIGWIRFNDCPTSGSSTGCGTASYGVSIDATSGEFSGYAWSSTIGWISFNESGCPQGTCKAKLNSSGEVTGWAKVLGQASGAHGGWSGWISFNCSNTSTCGTSNYKTTVGVQSGQARPFSGYAWGSEVVGWIDMTGVSYYIAPAPAPTLTISASPAAIPVGGSTKLLWSSSNTVSCEVESADAVSGWTAGSRNLNQANPPGYTVSSITSNTVFWISCYNQDNVKVRKGVLVQVGNPDFTLQTASPSNVLPVGGTGGACYASYDFTITRAVPHSLYGWTNSVQFTASSSTLSGATYKFYDSPNGTTFSTGSITKSPGQAIVLRVEPASAPSGSHSVTITGTSAGVTRTTSFTICGTSVNPGGTGVIAPTRPKTIFKEI